MRNTGRVNQTWPTEKAHFTHSNARPLSQGYYMYLLLYTTKMQRQNTVFSMKCVHYISEGDVEWYSGGVLCKQVPPTPYPYPTPYPRKRVPYSRKQVPSLENRYLEIFRRFYQC